MGRRMAVTVTMNVRNGGDRWMLIILKLERNFNLIKLTNFITWEQ